ncbi:MAG: histidinol-phosphate aminotransferase family protein [Anaerolineae bacterium]|nr:histidinol-phosphate aminotransferase family protein [Anaerolineae bacterium]
MLNHLPLLPRATHGGPQAANENITDFSVNTNPLGPNPALMQIWREADLVGYPDPYYTVARTALANMHHWPVDGVVLGVGASELLHRIARVISPDDAVYSLGAPFGEFERAVALQRGRLTITPRQADLTTFAATLRQHFQTVVYLSNPHNPSGHLYSPAQLAPLLANEQTLLVLDEAYAPFAADVYDWPCQPNLIRVWSPGKAHGLLGMRLAYVLAHPDTAQQLQNAQPAWAIPSATAAVLAALPDQGDFLRRTMPQVRAWANNLALALGAQPSGIHYFMLQVDDAAQTAARLLALGIRVRNCTSFGYPHHIRIATRMPEVDRMLVDVLANKSLPINPLELSAKRN